MIWCQQLKVRREERTILATCPKALERHGSKNKRVAAPDIGSPTYDDD